MNDGWIKLHRKFLEWEWYGDHKVVSLFLHCLLKANHKDKKWRGNLIPRGTFITSYDSLSKETGLTKRELRTAFKKLESTGEIDKRSTSVNSWVTVTKYNEYQGSDKAETNERQTRDKRETTTKNDNNEKNEKKISPLISDLPTLQKMDDPLTEDQAEKLIQDYGKEKVLSTLKAMENWKPLLKKNKSTNLTCQKWIKKDAKQNGNSNGMQYYQEL